jgi:hypothetical protein
MATTTNYGWSTPDDTALVSQGAAAIRTLGSSVDTTVKALSPGTTAGDVDYYTSSTAKARLGIGTTGQVLTVAGGVPSWATSSSGGMTLLSTTTLSGTTTTISGISGSYVNLYVIIQGAWVNTTATAITIQPNGTSGISYGYLIGGGANQGSYTNISTSGWANLYAASTNAAQTNFHINLFNYAQSTYMKTWNMFGMVESSALKTITVAAGGIATTSAITSLAVKTENGTSTFGGGQVLIYGVK